MGEGLSKAHGPTRAQVDDLRRLVAQVTEVAESAENRQKAAHWRRYLSGTPSNRDPEGPIFTLDIGLPTWSRILGFDLEQYYADTYTQVRCQLLMRLYHHRHFGDDTVVGQGVGVSPVGVVLEPSMLGVPIVRQAEREPWAARDRPVVQDEEDLERLGMPDFYTAGEMPAVHRMYGEARELLEAARAEGWQVGFPAAVRGILGLAQAMRGPHEQILWDMLERPDFARKLFAYVTDFRCHYAAERARFLGEPLGKGHIGNDEVTVPLISPQLYAAFLLPCESRLSAFHGGLSCWHSCGDTGPLVHVIRQIPGIGQFYTGPWTDLEAVMRAFGADTPLDIAVNVVDDVLAASPERMEAKIRRVMAVCDGAALKLRAGAMGDVFDLRADLAQMRRWTEVARRVIRG